MIAPPIDILNVLICSGNMIFLIGLPLKCYFVNTT
jgi:hypothetical protein